MALDKNQSWIGQERIEGYGKFSTTRFTSTQQLSAIALISSVLIRAISSKITSDPKRFMVITFALVLLDSGGTQVDQGSSNYRPSPLHHRPSSAPLLFILDAKPQSNCNLRNHQASRDCTVLEYGQGVSTAERSSTSSISPESVGRWSSIVAGQEILAILSDSWSSSSRWLYSTLVARTGFAKIQGQGENQAFQIEIQNKHNRAHHQLWTSSEVEKSEPRRVYARCQSSPTTRRLSSRLSRLASNVSYWLSSSFHRALTIQDHPQNSMMSHPKGILHHAPNDGNAMD
ncbi:hypothetical protein EV360DRAFT_69851 [Lentinula raphanica]|nr:hypothetical protein EV360DRAFT_69851 [Lentinula raphanica]